MQNLHRIMGAHFTHFKPNLCRGCQHFSAEERVVRDGWYGLCLAKGSTLCCERTEKARCRDYEAKGDEAQTELNMTTLGAALTEFAEWSRANPGHVIGPAPAAPRST